MDVMGALAVAGQALDIVKKLRDLDGDVKQAEAKMQLVELYDKLGKVRMALTDAQAALKEKDAEIAKLKEVRAMQAETRFHQGFHFGLTPDGHSMGLPFCPKCYSNGEQLQLVHMVETFYQCPRCEVPINNPPTELPPSVISGR